MVMRLNPPPGWPPVPEDVAAQPGWQPDPSWPPVPPGWQLWIDDGQPAPFGTPAAGYSASSYPTSYPPGPFADAGPYGTPQPPAIKTNGMAIASFILGLLGVSVLAIIFGFIGLDRIKKHGEKGRGLAIAGLILSGVWLVLTVVVLSLASRFASNGSQPASLSAPAITSPASSTPASPASSSPASSASPAGVSPFALGVGDCFDNPVGGQNLITAISVLPCTQPHDQQVFAKFSLGGSNYPGDAAVQRQANSGCNSRSSDVDQSKTNSSMRLYFLYPTSGNWILGQRTVICAIGSPNQKLSSSLLNPGAG